MKQYYSHCIIKTLELNASIIEANTVNRNRMQEEQSIDNIYMLMSLILKDYMTRKQTTTLATSVRNANPETYSDGENSKERYGK